MPITVDPEPLLVTTVQPTVESDLFRLFYRHGQPRHDNSVREEKQQPTSSFVEDVVSGDTLSLSPTPFTVLTRTLQQYETILAKSNNFMLSETLIILRLVGLATSTPFTITLLK